MTQDQEEISISVVSVAWSILADWHDVASPLQQAAGSCHHMCSLLKLPRMSPSIQGQSSASSPPNPTHLHCISKLKT